MAALLVLFVSTYFLFVTTSIGSLVIEFTIIMITSNSVFLSGKILVPFITIFEL